MSDTTSKTPTRPDMSALRTDPKSPGVLCLNGTYLRELREWIEHLERHIAAVAAMHQPRHGKDVVTLEPAVYCSNHFHPSFTRWPCDTATALGMAPSE